MTFDTFDQSDEATWPDQKTTMTKTNTKTKTITKTNTFREHLQRAILETCDLWDIWLKRWGDMTMTMTNTKTKTMTKTNTLRAPSKSDPSDLWHLRHWLHFWQLRTWIPDNLCYLTIKSDTGQHSQFLRCLYAVIRLGVKHFGGSCASQWFLYVVSWWCFPLAFSSQVGWKLRQVVGQVVAKGGCAHP